MTSRRWKSTGRKMWSLWRSGEIVEVIGAMMAAEVVEAV